ncbi:MAG: trypsin-like peptidase domain-containing protein [Candidatus Melainabacteria bacterium]|nr:trypsin-like peptidase domain-containing protein [Candidatus Melainabacteria bacterium]
MKQIANVTNSPLPLNRGTFQQVTTRFNSTGRKEMIPVQPINAELVERAGYGEFIRTLVATATVRSEDIFGSGFVISPDGGMLTASHVLDFIDTGKIKICLNMIYKNLPDDQVTAKVIHRSKKYDLALLALPEIQDPYHRIQFANTEPSLGESVYTLGSNGLTIGQVLFNKGFLNFGKLDETSKEVDYLSTNTASSGDSGAVLCNELGHAYGLATGVIPSSNGNLFKRLGGSLILGLAELHSRFIGNLIKIPNSPPINKLTVSAGLEKIRGFLRQVGVNLDDLMSSKNIRSSNKVYLKSKK